MVRIRLFLVVGLLASLLGLVPLSASDTPDPSGVAIAGSLQDELGCPGDWQPDCAATELAFDGEDAVWQATFNVPGGAWEYKAALNDTWDENYGAGAVFNGPNIPLALAAATDVKFYYDHETHWVTDNSSSIIATVPGNFQTHLGCAADWNPACLRSWLQDADGDGIASFSTTAIPAGDYEAKVTIDEAWDENYGAGGVPGGPNVAFSVPGDGALTEFTYDTVTHILTISSNLLYDTVAVVGSLQSELGCPDDWQPDCANTELTRDADDGVYRDLFNVPAGNWEYKTALNDSWDENYGANAVPGGANILLDLAAATDVTFYYSPVTNWITDNVNSRIVTAAGSFQDELGCPGDWDPSCLNTWLQDVDGDGTYTFATDAIPAGDYEAKATIGESWDENYGAGGVPGGANIAFTSFGRTVTFSFVSATNVLTIDADGLPGIDNDIQWDDLGHDSRDGMFRNPGAAVATDTDVTLRFRAQSGDLEFATMRLWDDRADVQSFVPMTKVLDDGTYEWWEATLATGSEPTVYWYRFIAQDGEAIAYYEDDDARLGGWGQTYGDSPDNSWQLTVFDPAFETPDWVKNAVVYQLFPDRFRDGDEDNNTASGGFFYEERTTEFRSAGTDWLTPICEPRTTGDISNGDYLLECEGLFSQNFYGGDLQGVIDKLDYLEELGVTALYLNPIFESPSNHRYDTTDYLAIEDSLGDLDTFIELVDEAHDAGINVILDGVFNHTSSDSIYFDRYSRYDEVGACESLDSPTRDWYFFAEGGGPCAGDTDYTAWFGFDSLPKLDSSNQAVRDLIFASGPDAVA
ncbi:MAG: alpha-amylase family glycosyl hydrolase, partial [Actinomycetota bacterium]|nr:alpha-amylase family glycosyl hydrolase [Actinomycetota bacterium]